MTTSEALSRRDAVIAGALVCAALGFVVVSAIVISWATPSAAPNTNAEPLRLEAPVTDRDIATADLAVHIRDALDTVESNGSSALPLGGFRNTGRGWFARTDSTNYEQSIASALETAGLLQIDELRDAERDILIHQCGEFFAVIAPSTVLSDPEDLALWDSAGCTVVESLVRDGPVFVAIGGR